MYLEEGPQIAFHAGKCCGIKTIYCLGYNPEAKCREIQKVARSESVQNADQYGHDVSSAFNFYNGDAPIETVEERIRRYVKYLDAVRPHGIIEIALTDYGSHGEGNEFDQIEAFGDLLKELGFKQVNDCHNSNSGNRIFIFHRNTDKD